jgi:hypothetical protein
VASKGASLRSNGAALNLQSSLTRTNTVPNRMMKSALMVAGAAAGVAAAATWLGKKRNLQAVPPPSDGAEPREQLAGPRDDAGERRDTEIRQLSGERREFAESRDFDTLIERDSVELPIGRSADPEIDASLSRSALQDDTSGASLLAEHEEAPRSADIDLALDDIWSSTPGIAEPEQSEGYDAVLPEDLGAVWIQRATHTTRNDRPQVSEPRDVPHL